MKYFDELLDVLQKYSLDKKDVILCNSCALTARNLYENSDIDILIRPGIREEILRTYNIKTLGTGTFDLSEHVQSVWNKYESFGYSDKRIFRMTNLLAYNGIAVVPLEMELTRKINENREKDAVGIRNIERYIISGGQFDFNFFRSLLDELYKNRNFGERIKIWLKYCNPKRNGIGPFSLALGIKLKQHIVTNEMIVPKKGFLPHLTYLISPGELLEIQGEKGYLMRYDVVVNYQSIQEYTETKDKGSFYLYIKKQNRRGGEAQLDNFILLIDNMKRNGYSIFHPILVDAEGKLIDGAHRLACALYFNIDFVSVRIVQKRAKIKYDRDWFVHNGFTQEELSAIDNTASELALKNGIYTTAIIWGYAESEWENIKKIIESKYPILESGILDLEGQMSDFIQEIYHLDSIALWKILFKNMRLASYSQRIMYIVFDCPTVQFQNREDGISINKEIIRLKASIRSRISKNLKDYINYSDTIIHMGDNPYSNKKIREIIHKYAERKMF